MENTFDPIAYADYVGKELVAAFKKAGLSTTPGQIGAARETAARKNFEQILPPGIGVGSGFVIDSYGGTSRQIDVVIYEKNICPVYSINDDPGTSYYPCEGVVAVGEIKSNLDSDTLEDIFCKMKSVKQLKRFTGTTTEERQYGMRVVNEFIEPYRSYGTTAHQRFRPTGDTDYNQEDNPIDQIFGFALAGKLKLTPETLCEKFVSRAKEIDPILCPNLIVTLDKGVLCPDTPGEADEMGKIGTSIQETSGIYHVNNEAGNFRFLLSMIYGIYTIGRTVSVSAFVQYFDEGEFITLPGGGIHTLIERNPSETD